MYILANRAYKACLRGQLSSNVRPHRLLPSHCAEFMYRCPHCEAALRKRDVWPTGPFATRACLTCGKPYFCGGMPAAFAAICAGFYLGPLLYLLTGSLWALLLPPLVGAGIALLLMFQSQPVDARRRWKVLASAIASASILWVAAKFPPFSHSSHSNEAECEPQHLVSTCGRLGEQPS